KLWVITKPGLVKVWALCIKKGCASVLTQPRFFILHSLHSINKCEIALCTFNFVPFRRSNNQSSEIIDDKRR
ncbi:hypothetical protein, partial [Bacteroides faecis]|uniref:hypothetical protein n=1 Tax=Bacteroides faecis TaxID=674529 RepID=UPI001C6FC6AC